MNKAQKIIISIWLFFSSFWVIAVGINKDNLILFLLGSTLFFVGLFVLFGLKKKKKN